jgi:putative transposase
VKCACIAQHVGEFSVRMMCAALQIAPATYYAWRGRRPSARVQEDTRLKVMVRRAHEQSRSCYGSPRIHVDLQAAGERVSRKRVARLMREERLRGKKRRGFRVTTDSAHLYPIAANVLSRGFAVEKINGLDRAWGADITYLPTREGWLYLAVVLDLGMRAVVGWSMRASLESALCEEALEMALLRRRPGAGLLHHSDRGVQYASLAYRAQLERAGVVVSMSRRGNCWDNAVVESFFATLKCELVNGSDWHTRNEARRDVFEYIEVWYNRQRRHSALGYLTPAEFERQLGLKPIATAA